MLILSMDQSSNLSGVSLWKEGNLQNTTLLKSDDPKHSYGRRLATQVHQLERWLDLELTPNEHIDLVLFELVKAPLVLTTVGAFCCVTHLQHCRLHPMHTFVASSSWKSWAKRKGATGPFREIKGVKALKEAGFDVDKHSITSEDIADSVMIYKAWEERQ